MTVAQLAAPELAPSYSTDSALLPALALHDGAAFAERYARSGNAAYLVVVRLLAEHGIAEGVVQEVFFAVWRRAASFDPARGDVEAWPLTSVRHAALSRLRGKQERLRFDVPLDRIAGLTTGDDPQAIVEARELRERVRQGLDDLPAARASRARNCGPDSPSPRRSERHRASPDGGLTAGLLDRGLASGQHEPYLFQQIVEVERLF